MKDLKKPDSQWLSYSYDDLIESMEVEVLIEKHDGSYQGDSFYLVQKGDEYGLLIFGWGSCSGCDALESCSTYEQVVNLRNNMYEEIDWMPLDEFKNYILNKDFETEWYFHYEGGKDFVNQLREWSK